MILRGFLLFFVICCMGINIYANQHPIIWVTDAEREVILVKIDQYDWAKSIVNQLHENVDEELEKHLGAPESIMDRVPKFASSDHEFNDANGQGLSLKHSKVLSLAANSAMLYYLTQEEKYGQFAADILGVYVEHLAPKTPQTTTISGNAFYDPRTTYEVFALAYDFAYDYLVGGQASYYSPVQKKRVGFDNTEAQKAIKNMVGNTLQEYGKPDVHGSFISNHPILTAPSVLYGILCVEDFEERDRLFDVFWNKGTKHQSSFQNTILPMFGEQGIWPESTSYSFMSPIHLILNIVDRVYPDMQVVNKNRQLFDGVFLFDNLRMPDRRFVRYGDSKRNNDGTKNLYAYTLAMAKRKGDDDMAKKAMVALRQAYDAQGGRESNLSPYGFNNYSALQLFWGEEVPDSLDQKLDFTTPTVIIKHAGIALQRNYVAQENEKYGLCGIIGGAHYVHSHLTGIAMELYGQGYVMGPNAGLPPTVKQRWLPVHENYFRLYAGNNTVIVNGTSHGLDEGAWKGKSYVWQNTTVNVAAEPQHLEAPLTPFFSFATQYLNDEVNNCDQERTLSTIRTSPTTAYYFDMFRSKSRNENEFHDYVYHNIGDKMHINDAQGKCVRVKTTQRYQNDIGDPVASPGWRYFEKTKSTDASSESIHVRFDLQQEDKYMHVWTPAGVEREYTKALAPPTREAKNGYVEKKTQVLAIRQKGEAWDRPFIHIFEPSASAASSVVNVEHLYADGKNLGAKVVSDLGSKVITDFIICLDGNTKSVYFKEENIHFTGRYAIVRVEEEIDIKSITLYVGDGQKLSLGDHSIDTSEKGKGLLIIN